jgi:hypothetical protein
MNPDVFNALLSSLTTRYRNNQICHNSLVSVFHSLVDGPESVPYETLVQSQDCKEGEDVPATFIRLEADGRTFGNG